MDQGDIMTSTELFMFHQTKYPMMDIIDHVKRLHQMVYGPHHLYNQPSLEQIVNDLQQELSEIENCECHDDWIPLGEGYYRMDLWMIKQSKLTIEQAANMFHSSILDVRRDLHVLDQLMEDSLKLLSDMINDQRLPLDTKTSQPFIDEYRLKHYPALHHSEHYRKYYQPHYRVIHERYMPKNIAYPK